MCDAKYLERTRRSELNTNIHTLRLEPRELHAAPVITGQRLFFRTLTELFFVGLKSALSFLSLLDQDTAHDAKSRAPQLVPSLAIAAEISPTIRPKEKPVAYEQVAPEAPPRKEELGRFLERRRAAELGHELSLYSSEAADYIGLSRAALDQLVSRGEIPNHPQPHQGEKRLFYATELNEWLAKNADQATEDLHLASHVTRGTERELR